MNSMLDEAEVLFNDCDKYCFINDIDFVKTESHKILDAIISKLSTFLKSMERDDPKDFKLIHISTSSL